jgi:hypothetical protein
MCDKRALEEASFGPAWGVEYQHIWGLGLFMFGFGFGVYGRHKKVIRRDTMNVKQYCSMTAAMRFCLVRMYSVNSKRQILGCASEIPLPLACRSEQQQMMLLDR